jgi:hypothetical protein
LANEKGLKFNKEVESRLGMELESDFTIEIK